MRSELDPVGFDFADLGETEHLKTAAIGENRLVPIHELVQPAGGGDDIKPGPDVQVIGVAKDDLSTALQQFARIHGLDAGLGADRHVNRRVHDAVRGFQFAQPGLRV